MQDRDAEARRAHPSGLLEGVSARWDLLWRRLRGTPVESREGTSPAGGRQASAFDLPLDMCRMQFARWLVERGKLSEESDHDQGGPDTSDGLEKPSWDRQVARALESRRRVPYVTAGVSCLIAIPTYNERQNITSLLDEIHDTIPGGDILVIDDNSPDGTGTLLDSLAARHPYLRVIHRPGKLGLGTAYVCGFQYAIDHGYDFVCEMDADHSHDPDYLPDIMRAAEHADLVIGSRYVSGGGAVNWPPLRRLISGGGNTFARALLGIPAHDCTSGFRCYDTRALRAIDLSRIRAEGYAFQVEMAYIFWKRGYRVREVPIVFEDRREGKSKMSLEIVAEALLWVLRTRLLGDPAARRVPTDAAAGTGRLERRPEAPAT